MRMEKIEREEGGRWWWWWLTIFDCLVVLEDHPEGPVSLIELDPVPVKGGRDLVSSQFHVLNEGERVLRREEEEEMKKKKKRIVSHIFAII